MNQIIQGAEVGAWHRYQETKGDTWIGTWADDDAIYSVADDTRWPSFTSQDNATNLALYKLSGNDPHHLAVEAVNPMYEYGYCCERWPNGCAWKATGIICVDGVLYMGVGFHDYPWAHDPQPADRRQLAHSASIIKSTDHGQTWQRSMQENYDSPMFAGSRFGAPFFIEYGKNSSSIDTANGADEFVYALSNDGFWNNGSSLVLGRVKRDLLSRLQAGDWEFYCGDQIEWKSPHVWSRNLSQAIPVLLDPHRIGMSAVTFVPGLKRYLLMQWHYPLHTFGGKMTTWVFREAPAPWGPWTAAHEVTFHEEGWYSPCLLSKFLSADGKEGVIIAGGDCFQQETFYKLHVIPVRFRT